MSTVLVIGAGGVSSVCVHKMAQNPNVFSQIHLASRTLAKCDAIAESVKARESAAISTYEIDAEEVPAMVNLIRKIEPSLVVNLALPYQDLPIMDACLEAGVNYLDTANYEPKDEAKFEYKWQWAYHDRFKQAGLMALLGSGFDPGVTSVFAMWLRKHKLKTIRQLDILDCNGGDHGQAFATNFNPEINIREVTAPARHWERAPGGEGGFVETPALSTHHTFDFEAVGPRNAYLMYHEELESLSKFIPELERGRFWMTFGEEYIKHLTVLQNVGMTGIDPIKYQGQEIVPLQFLAAVLPKPETLGETTTGNTNIGVIATGDALDGSGEKTFYINNICSHEAAFEETGNQGVSYTTGVPAMIGSALMLNGTWAGADGAGGVFNMEEMDPDPFMEMLNTYGLPWNVNELSGPVEF
ncbi:MAG: saccharopine dehydrogenase family protein [Erythrobacter sp.]